jgi:hypothetical protein
MPSAAACSKCGTALPAQNQVGAASFPCTGCGELLSLELYPAFFRSFGKLPQGETPTAEGEASCYYHQQKKATLLCSDCGRFLCALCEVRIGEASLCPSCIEKGFQQGGKEALVTHRTLYDSLSLSLSLLPIFLVFITVVTAPISIYIALRNWNSPGSLLPRSKFRFVCAIVCSSLQIIGWGALLVSKL